jgi:membrane protease subunit (stomatin/prohibitin family)
LTLILTIKVTTLGTRLRCCLIASSFRRRAAHSARRFRVRTFFAASKRATAQSPDLSGPGFAEVPFGRRLAPNRRTNSMAITRQVITALNRDGTDMLGTRVVAIKITDESIVSGSLLTVESNHFCVLKSRGAVLDVYETGQYPLVTPDKPIVGSLVQGFFGGASPWVYEVIYINRAKLLVRSSGIATTAEMAEVSYQADYYIHVDSKQAALDLITHLPFTGNVIDTQEIADYAGPAIEQAINQVVQVTKLERINEHINELRESVKVHLADFLRTYGILLNDLKVLVLPKDERMRELISLQALGLSPLEAVRYYLALRMAEKGLVSAPNAAAGVPFAIGGAQVGVYPVPGTGPAAS